MKYELYIDVFILSNFCMDTLALILTGIFLRKKRPVRILALTAFLGTIAATALFLCLTNYLLYVILVHFLVNPLMVWLAFRPKNKREFLGEWVACYLVVLLAGGMMQWLYVTIFHGNHIGICIALTFLAGLAVAAFWEKQMVVGKRTYDVRLQVGTDTVELKAYYDTGNLLMDPYFDEPVHIVAEGKLQECLSRNRVSGRLVSFSSLGEKNGWIKTYTIDELTVYQKNDVLQIKPAVVGVTTDRLFKHGDYQMILNSHLRLK